MVNVWYLAASLPVTHGKLKSGLDKALGASSKLGRTRACVRARVLFVLTWGKAKGASLRFDLSFPFEFRLHA